MSRSARTVSKAIPMMIALKLPVDHKNTLPATTIRSARQVTNQQH